jgi:hypothetical protein
LTLGGEGGDDMGSLLGRIILTIGALITLMGVNIADWNDTHVFSELWSPHARFHGAWWIFAISLLSALCLWLLWSRQADRQFQTTVAVLIQACIWMAFFPAMLIPGAALADPGKRFDQIAGLDANLFLALVQVAILIVGYALARSAKGAPREQPDIQADHHQI